MHRLPFAKNPAEPGQAAEKEGAHCSVQHQVIHLNLYYKFVTCRGTHPVIQKFFQRQEGVPANEQGFRLILCVSSFLYIFTELLTYLSTSYDDVLCMDATATGTYATIFF